jgi:hypothetical protein
MVLVAAGTWLVGCGDDAKPGAPRRTGGSAGMAGSAGAVTGGTGGSAGSPAGGTAGSTGGALGGSAGSTAGSAGSAGKGTAGDTSVGGEGGDNQAGGGGTGGSSGAGTGGTAGADQGGQGGEGGMGGEGGASASMCSTADLDVELVSATGTQRHDHLPINGTFRTTLLGMINTGSPLTFTLPPEGMNVHDHTLTFTAPQLATLRNGGALQMNVTSSVDGPTNNQHTHTYAIDCEP